MNKCGSCTLCCLLTHIPELEKPVYKLCEFCEDGAGCGRYRIRPAACKEYSCVWLSENLPNELRPDLCHVMFERLPGSSTYVGLVKPGHHISWLTDTIQKFVEGKIGSGSAVIVNAKGARFIKGPEGMDTSGVIKELKESYSRLMEL